MHLKVFYVHKTLNILSFAISATNCCYKNIHIANAKSNCIHIQVININKNFNNHIAQYLVMFNTLYIIHTIFIPDILSTI